VPPLLRSLLLATACTLAHTGFAAQEDDPLKSAACGEAIAQLDTARAQGGDAARLVPLRQRAATICFGAAQPPGRSARVLQAPVVVPPPVINPATPPAPSLPRLAPLPPPVVVERAPMPAHCDAAGCWAQDGPRLRHVPPGLGLPGAACAQHGGVVYCP
jgi:hypothetical protein